MISPIIRIDYKEQSAAFDVNTINYIRFVTYPELASKLLISIAPDFELEFREKKEDDLALRTVYLDLYSKWKSVTDDIINSEKEFLAETL